MDLRNTLYDRGVFEINDLGARVISVGNITTGGTGKTPLVAYIASYLADQGEKVCVLTRGYGRENAQQRVLVSDGERVLVDARNGGDEPVELAHKLLGKAVVIADADRVSAGEWAVRRFGTTTFVLDDGFQHRKVKRDLDIVCIDATNPCGGGKVLPAGRLREPLDHLARADCVVITRSDLVDDLPDLRSRLARWNSHAAIFEAKNVISAIAQIGEFHAKTQSKKTIEGASFAFCGLANPDNFFGLLRREKFDVASSKAFADHFVYTQRDIDDICTKAKANGAQSLVTTAKDAVKISNLTFEIPCFVVEIEMTVDDKKAFEVMLND